MDIHTRGISDNSTYTNTHLLPSTGQIPAKYNNPGKQLSPPNSLPNDLRCFAIIHIFVDTGCLSTAKKWSEKILGAAYKKPR